MSTTREQIYFVFCPRDGESTQMKGNSIISIQEFEMSSNITIPQEIKDPETGKRIFQENSIPGVNYSTAVLSVDGFTNEAIVTITRKTKTGDETFTFKINDKECSTYMDDKYIMKFGISKFELEEYSDPSEADAITRRNVERVRQIAHLNKINVLSAEDYSPSNRADEEPNL